MTTPSDARRPIRTCVGCGRRRPQAELVRCVLVDGRAVVSRTAPGRGAWLCGVDCIEAACRRRGFQRAWRRDVDAGQIDRLQAVLSETNECSGWRTVPPLRD